MSRADDCEVLAIEGRKLHDAESLGGCHDRCIDRPERKVSIVGDQLGDPDPVASLNRLRDQVPRCEVAEEPDLSFRAKSRLQQVRHFGHHELRDDEWPRMALEQ